MTQAAAASTAQSYAPPSVTQFSVFLDNRVGKLLELLKAFEDHPTVQVCAFSVQEASDYAVVRLVTNSSRCARDLLVRQRLPFSETDILVVEVGRDHSLTRLCLFLLGAELNIQFCYPVLLKPNGAPTIALAVDDLTLAGQILRKKEFRLLGECDLPGPCPPMAC
ncbi:MAG TPA: acetolactate synthase [Phycisphaerales bacterium]|nr:acetolactate synthase [Phycisphaerales bacterium]